MYFFYTTMSDCMIFYGLIVPDINYYYYLLLLNTKKLFFEIMRQFDAV